MDEKQLMRISIITVSYNSAATIRDTLESVLAQTYKDIEYLVVDGDSTDGTLEIIKEFEPKFKGRMHWISEPDNGLYDAMNNGIRMATGDIVGIINSDDFYIHPDVIEKVADTFQFQNSLEAVFGDVRFARGNNIDKTIRYYSAKKFTPKRFRFGFMPPHPTFFTKKDNFEKYGYYHTNFTIASDYELLIRFLYTHQLKYQYIPLDMMKMRIGGKSTVSIKSNWILNEEIVRACRENGIYTNMFILSLKYFVKFFELVFTKN